MAIKMIRSRTEQTTDQVLVCQCGCVFTAENSDGIPSPFPEGRNLLYFKCPECRHSQGRRIIKGGGVMRKVSERQHHEETTYRREFDHRSDQRGCRHNRDLSQSGYTFECDAEGNVDTAALNPAALANYRKCLSGEHNVIDRGVVPRDDEWTDPAVWVCCETEFHCDRFTNTCPDCGTDYNGSGQQLADRSQWGEETGEHLSDILRIE
jgi:hypothetical protein